MNEKRSTTRAKEYAAPALELHTFGVEQGFAGSATDYLEIEDNDYKDGPGFGGDYNDLDF
ncbi:hypothetical protein [uncultured Alistipes sp.]|uniref:hypothetical protein n=1 Tax=uncultured Alistipes sp. TaxID=538949 RepID=UPI0026106CCF|nr:hypothetical protein [uncultured Alistipes sp.]